MRACSTIAILLVFAQYAAARLGESPRECARRYGEPVGRVALADGSGYEYHYQRGNYEIAIRFVRTNKTIFQPIEAGYISYAKQDHSALDNKTVETLLDKNLPDQVLYTRMSRDMFWEEVDDIAQEDIEEEWVRRYRYHEFEDGRKVEKIGYAEARANLSEDHVLTITSSFPLPRGYKDHEEREEAEEERLGNSRTVEDFF